MVVRWSNKKFRQVSGTRGGGDGDDIRLGNPTLSFSNESSDVLDR